MGQYPLVMSRTRFLPVSRNKPGSSDCDDGDKQDRAEKATIKALWDLFYPDSNHGLSQVQLSGPMGSGVQDGRMRKTTPNEENSEVIVKKRHPHSRPRVSCGAV